MPLLKLEFPAGDPVYWNWPSPFKEHRPMAEKMMTILLPRSDALLVMAALRQYANTCMDDVERKDALLIECLLGAHVAVARANEALDTKDR